MKRAALYVRVSTQEQKLHGLSVDSQIKALEEYCSEHGYEVKSTYNDAGISARKSYKNRPALLQMIEDCKQKKIDIVLFTKLDRFFRSVPDYYACIEQMSGVPWRAIWEDYETETSAGVFKVNIMLSVAQAESDRTSERIRSINDYRRQRGDVVGGQAPIGYVSIKSRYYKDPQTQEGVDAFFRTYLSVMMPRKAIEAAAEHGLKITRQQSTRMLKSEVYCGNAHGSECEPYVTEEEHRLIMDSVEGRRMRDLGKDRVYLFTGLIVCPMCGGSFCSKIHITDPKHKYKAYACSNRMSIRGCTYKRQFHEGGIEKYLLANLDRIMEESIADAEQNRTEAEERKKQIKRLSARLQRIGERFEDGDIDRDEYRTKRDKIKSEIQSLEAMIPVSRSERLPEGWKEEYLSLDEEHKRSFWRHLIKQIVPLEDRTFAVSFR